MDEEMQQKDINAMAVFCGNEDSSEDSEDDDDESSRTHSQKSA